MLTVSIYTLSAEYGESSDILLTLSSDKIRRIALNSLSVYSL